MQREAVAGFKAILGTTFQAGSCGEKGLLEKQHVTQQTNCSAADMKEKDSYALNRVSQMIRGHSFNIYWRQIQQNFLLDWKFGMRKRNAWRVTPSIFGLITWKAEIVSFEIKTEKIFWMEIWRLISDALSWLACRHL